MVDMLCEILPRPDGNLQQMVDMLCEILPRPDGNLQQMVDMLCEILLVMMEICNKW